MFHLSEDTLITSITNKTVLSTMHRLLWSGVFISLEQMVGMTMAGSLLRQCCRDFCCCCLFKNGQMVLQSGSSIYTPSSNADPFPYSLATICFCYYSYFRWFTYCVVMLTCDLFILVFVVYANMHEHGFTCSCGDQKSTSGVQLYNFPLYSTEAGSPLEPA